MKLFVITISSLFLEVLRIILTGPSNHTLCRTSQHVYQSCFHGPTALTNRMTCPADLQYLAFQVATAYFCLFYFSLLNFEIFFFWFIITIHFLLIVFCINRYKWILNYLVGESTCLPSHWRGHCPILPSPSPGHCNSCKLQGLLSRTERYYLKQWNSLLVADYFC